MPAAPKCLCGTCATCKNRAYGATFRAKRKGWQGGRDFLNRRAPSPPAAQPVAWSDYLTQIRELVPHSVVRVHDGGKVTVYPLCEPPRTWPDLEACLAALTAPVLNP